MRKTAAVALALMMASLVVPEATAQETVTDTYTALGVWPLPGFVRTSFEVDLVASDPYANVVVTTSEWAPISLCFWDPASSDPSCATDGHASELSCGINGLGNTPFPSDTVTVWVHQYGVTESLEYCFGTAGAVSGTFY